MTSSEHKFSCHPIVSKHALKLHKASGIPQGDPAVRAVLFTHNVHSTFPTGLDTVLTGSLRILQEFLFTPLDGESLKYSGTELHILQENWKEFPVSKAERLKCAHGNVCPSCPLCRLIATVRMLLAVVEAQDIEKTVEVLRKVETALSEVY